MFLENSTHKTHANKELQGTRKSNSTLPYRSNLNSLKCLGLCYKENKERSTPQSQDMLKENHCFYIESRFSTYCRYLTLPQYGSPRIVH